MLTQKRLKELLDYNPLTGVFLWRSNRSNVPAGAVAGCARVNGYVRISVDDKIYRAHQLAWLWVTGSWPAKFLDHRDTNKNNNAFDNLREANKSQNMANRGKQKNNTSGLKGAHRYKAGEKYGKPWQAGIVVNSQRIALGHFETAEAAHAAYCAAAEKYFNEFARAS